MALLGKNSGVTQGIYYQANTGTVSSILVENVTFTGNYEGFLSVSAATAVVNNVTLTSNVPPAAITAMIILNSNT